MIEKAARFLAAFGAVSFILAAVLGPGLKAEPFHTYFYLISWWSYILFADAWLYLRGGDSLILARPVRFLFFLAPFSAVLWFGFEAFNFRLQNWHYLFVPGQTALRWAGNFLAFATVLPGLFLTANLLDHYGVFRKNEFSQFFVQELPAAAFWGSVSAGTVLLALPLIWPKLFFPLVWIGFVFLIDPVNAAWGKKSLIQEWRQGNWNRTLQLLSAGLLCGFLWESWNYWAGAKWAYSVPLPEWLGRDLKIFEMPLLGFLGFPPFALECFVLAEFAEGLKEKIPAPLWKTLAAAALFFSLAMCRFMDLLTVRSFR
jgi:hypothetical protein